MDCLAVSGTLSQTMDALSRFGQPGQARVLVLSSQRNASGTNLQCARNVVIVHPYVTPTATFPEAISYKELVAYERQCVGRVRRFPQTKEVKVFRLFAEFTIEAELYSRRNPELEGSFRSL